MSAIAQHIMDILASLETENILQNQIPSPSDHKLFKQQDIGVTKTTAAARLCGHGLHDSLENCY